LRDVANLVVEATANADTYIGPKDCNSTSNARGYELLFYKFAHNPDTKRMYWSASHPVPEYHRDTFWALVPNIQGEVREIFGAYVYESEVYDVRGIYVFIKRTELDKNYLSYLKFDLKTQSWSDLADLDLPHDEIPDFHAVVKQSAYTAVPPKLIVQLHGQRCYVRSISSEGSVWSEEEWEIHSLDDYNIKAIVGLGANAGNYHNELWVAQGVGGDTKIYYRYFGDELEDGRWYFMDENFNINNYLGACFKEEEKGYIFYEGEGNSENLKYVLFKKPGSSNAVSSFDPITYKRNPVNYNEKEPETFFDDLKHNTGLNLDIAPWGIGLLTSNLDQIPQFSSPSDLNGLSLKDLLILIANEPGNSGLREGAATFVLHNLLYLYGDWSENNENARIALNYADNFLKKYGVPENTLTLDKAINRLCGLSPQSVELNSRFPRLELISADSEEIIWNEISNLQGIEKIAIKSGRVITSENYGDYFSFYQKKINDETSESYFINTKYAVTLDETFDLWLNANPTGIPLHPVIYGNQIHVSLSYAVSSEVDLLRKDITEKNYRDNLLDPSDYELTIFQTNLEYIKEAHYYIPLHLAIQLRERGHYLEALDWIRTVYDYTQAQEERKVYYGLIAEENIPFDEYSRTMDWLRDPLNPHLIAANRPGAYTQFTKMVLMRCLIAYADAEYTLDTVESVARAKMLYETVLDLCACLPEGPRPCEAILDELDIVVGDDYYVEVWQEFVDVIVLDPEEEEIFDHPNNLRMAIEEIKEVMAGDRELSEKLVRVKKLIAKHKASSPKPSLAEKIAESTAYQSKITAQLAVQKPVRELLEKVVSPSLPSEAEEGASNLRTIRADHLGYYTEVFTPAPNFSFCIPVNPVPRNLCLKSALNLYKIRNCMNIAGVVRDLEPYAAPTDTVSGLPQIGGGGNLVLPGAINIQPTQYHYKVLIERAKQLVSIAQGIENAFLSALEKRDAEYYNLMKAKQDLSLSKAGIRLQDLRIKEAEGSVKLAELQRDRAQLQVNGLQEMIDAGLNAFELTMIDLMNETRNLQLWAARLSIGAAAVQAAAAVASFLTYDNFKSGGATSLAYSASALSSTSQGISGYANAKSTFSSIASIYANYERRKQEWNFQKSLAEQDINIGNQQINLAEDHVRVVGQEKVISEMQAEFARETVDFLTNKFTNVELYDWMSGVLENVYAYFLQQATSMGHLAANQLAFERQEVPPPFIQSDYWQAPADNAVVGTIGGNEVDRRGLTGSARLLQDIYQLDQYAFQSDQRKLQLTKTVSLSSLSPVEFQQFKENGIMTFHLPMELFDRDFPGHYLRLIKKVRTSVVALVPPVEGIKASLTNTGITRVVLGGSIFQKSILRRPPEVVALTSPREATGLFELQTEGEFLNPFEGLGVDSLWEFRMEKAGNLFDYRTIADVLITLEYTALNSFDYGRQVKTRLNSDLFVSAMRPFSFKNQFADQWYDLHHPILEEGIEPTAMVRFKTTRADFPPNIDNLRIKAVSMYFVLDSGVITETEIEIDSLTIQDGNISVFAGPTVERLIGTRTHNPSWSSDHHVNQDWELSF
jgi:hypothetical protein